MSKTFEHHFCSVELTGTTHTPLICLAVINILLSVAAFIGNLLVLVALGKESPLHPPSKLLLRSLTTTDLFVGVVAEPLVVVYWVSVVKQNWHFCRYAQSAVYLAGHVLCSVSLLTLTTIAVERLLALLLGLRYAQVVTLKRTYITLTGLWIFSIFASALYFVDYLITLRIGYMGCFLCIAISFFCYAKIFCSLRMNQHNRVQHLTGPSARDLSVQNHRQFNIARYRKAVNSALWLQVALVVCYLPYGTIAMFMAVSNLTPDIYIVRQTALTLIFSNSSLNPILYCWKIKEVRKSVRETLTRLYRFSN
ncbi:histamine H2 receptor-like [Acropora palmata]|uniref:histamine H2 receptor-like n=1 Tax=Acropora palmata TaxID=6131 RepID=UPI003DA0EF16